MYPRAYHGQGDILNLKRKFDYLGPAWYKKECFIPAEWNEKDVFLTLERVIWNSQVWINGTKVEDLMKVLPLLITST